ncbi:MAG TPA: peptide chain release factor 2 [bacterium]|nr:peptide chain release factor 2 [bacterium]
MADELQNDLETLRTKVADLRKYLDVDLKEKRLVEIERNMAAPDFWTSPKAQDVTRERAQVARTIDLWKALQKDVQDSLELKELADMESDAGVLGEIRGKVAELRKRVEDAEVSKMLSGEVDANPANVTISAGQGGTEAQDWAQMLFRMYSRWAEKHGYRLEVLDEQPGEEAGYKSISFRVVGEYAYGNLKSERGVHRLVRVSPFDQNGRRQTSFAAVDVVAEIEDDIAVEINEADLKVDTYRSGGAGGQHVNKTESAIRITHIPTGTIVSCQMERSQHKNRSTAMKMLRARLYDLELQKRMNAINAAHATKMENSFGSQIRNYVLYPYRLVKDTRTGEQTSQADAVLDGDLDAFIRAYLLGKKADKSGKSDDDDDV